MATASKLAKSKAVMAFDNFRPIMRTRTLSAGSVVLLSGSALVDNGQQMELQARHGKTSAWASLAGAYGAGAEFRMDKEQAELQAKRRKEKEEGKRQARLPAKVTTGIRPRSRSAERALAAAAPVNSFGATMAGGYLFATPSTITVLRPFTATKDIHIVLLNSTGGSLAWRLTGISHSGKYYVVEPDSGVIASEASADVLVHFNAIKSGNIGQRKIGVKFVEVPASTPTCEPVNPKWFLKAEIVRDNSIIIEYEE